MHHNKHVGNKDGKFDLAGANFAKSARALKLTGATLSCELRTVSGQWIPASVDLDTAVENQNGRLVFINTLFATFGRWKGKAPAAAPKKAAPAAAPMVVSLSKRAVAAAKKTAAVVTS